MFRIMEFTGKENLTREQALRVCQQFIHRLADPNRLPLEREAIYLLGQMLRIQVEQLGLTDKPEVQEFLSAMHTRTNSTVRRFPEDFMPD
jgi:hypothetical protein